jgi:DNA polymerase V
MRRVSRPVPVPIDSATFQLPLIASPRATGFTQPTTDYEDVSIDFNRLIYRHPAATYVMRVAHDGLDGSDLLADDLVIIDCALTAQSGHLVVAQIEDAFLLCRFERHDGVILLTPENPGYQPVVVTAELEPTCLFGVVTYILHRPKQRRR